MKWILGVALLAGSLGAQQDPNERIQRLVSVKYIDPIQTQNVLANFGVDMKASREMKVLALSGRRSAVETAEAAIKQLDVAGAGPRDVELTAYFVVGRDDAPTNGPIPPDLQSTVAALKQTFPYKNYDLLDALALRSRAGSAASTTGQLGNGNLTSFVIRAVNVDGEGGMIRIDGLRAVVRALTPKGDLMDVSGVGTDVVDVKEGQRLVVGRSGMSGQRALFLVLMAKVAQ